MSTANRQSSRVREREREKRQQKQTVCSLLWFLSHLLRFSMHNIQWHLFKHSHFNCFKLQLLYFDQLQRSLSIRSDTFAKFHVFLLLLFCSCRYYIQVVRFNWLGGFCNQFDTSFRRCTPTVTLNQQVFFFKWSNLNRLNIQINWHNCHGFFSLLRKFIYSHAT